MEKKFQLNKPSMPNFLTMSMPARPRQEGLQELPKIPVGDLTEDEALEYAEWMKTEFIAHWKALKSKQ